MGAITAAVVNDTITSLLERVILFSDLPDRRFSERVGKSWLEQIEIQFATESGPYEPWAVLANYTVQRKKREGAASPSRKLYFTGRLSESFFYTARKSAVLMESRFPELVKKQVSGTGKSDTFGSPIPSRPIFPDADNIPRGWQVGIDAMFADVGLYLRGG